MRELAKMNGAEIQNLYLFQSISPLVIRKWEKIFCETYYLIWWGTNYLKKTLAYLYSWVRKHNYVIILRVGGVGVFHIMAYTGKLHPKGVPFFGSCSSCLEEKSPMVPNPDPKQKLKQLTEWHVIVFCEQSGETWRAAPTQLPLSGFRYMKAGKDFTSWSTAWKVLNYYVKGAPFASKTDNKGVPFLSKIIYKRIRGYSASYNFLSSTPLPVWVFP